MTVKKVVGKYPSWATEEYRTNFTRDWAEATEAIKALALLSATGKHKARLLAAALQNGQDELCEAIAEGSRTHIRRVIRKQMALLDELRDCLMTGGVWKEQ